MPVKIRLRRTGAKKVPFYRIVVVDSRCSPKGKFIEKLGWYDPRAKRIEADKEKILSWTNKGAQLTNSVRRLLINLSILSPDEIS